MKGLGQAVQQMSLLAAGYDADGPSSTSIIASSSSFMIAGEPVGGIA